MSQFMGEHRLDLGRGEARYQRVEENDALGRAEAGEIGVAVAGALRAIHYEKTSRAKSAFGKQHLDAFLQASILERPEFVEPSRDDRRVKYVDRQTERHPGRPDVYPPPVTHAFHEPQHTQQKRDSKEGAEGRLLGEIHKEQRYAHAVEPEACLDHEGAIKAEGQIEDARDEHDRNNQGDAVRIAARLEYPLPRFREKLQSAAEGEPQQKRGGDESLERS